MNHKLLPRLGSAIASTILSLFSGVLLVGVDKAQAAVLTYQINYEDSYFKVNDSSLTGIGVEAIAVSEGKLSWYGGYDLAGKIALFYQGVFRGLQVSGSNQWIEELIIPADEPFGPRYMKQDSRIEWRIETSRTSFTTWQSLVYVYSELFITTSQGGSPFLAQKGYNPGRGVAYILVNTEPEPVPEPLTVGGTALALAGLSWLKQKKKMAA